MASVDLFPDLSHCVETQAKREHGETMKKLLAAGQDLKDSEGLERKLELLQKFLEQTDFTYLRRQSEKHLMEGKQVKFTVYLEDGEPQYEMRVT